MKSKKPIAQSKPSFKGGFQFDEPTREFIKKIKSRKPVQPPYHHLELASTDKRVSYSIYFKK